jgi:predicted aspartyl protease
LRLPLLLIGLLTFGPASAYAQDLYQWTDENGQIHWVDDPTRIPAKHRPEAQPRGLPKPRIITESSPTAPSPDAQPDPVDEAPNRYSVPVEKAGLEIFVPATLNSRATVPVKVDTGAMVNTIPRSVAEDLGLPLGPTARKIGIVGVGGQPMIVPVVELRQVEVGGAIVENVEAAVLDTMNVGLLGMPFFRHFRVELDPVAGLLTLEDIDLDSVEGLYGGYPESYWRNSFGTVRTELEKIAEVRSRIPDEYTDLHRRLDDAEGFVRAEQERLDSAASRAGVPRSWR